MPVLHAADRLRLRQLHAFRCGYCGVSEADARAELTEDHFQPLARGGTNALDNIVYACHACNEFKGSHWNPAGLERVLHPLRDDIAAHVSETVNGTLIGRTLTGAFRIQRLRLNRPGLVAHRRERALVTFGAQRIAAIESEIAEIRTLVQELLRRTAAPPPPAED